MTEIKKTENVESTSLLELFGVEQDVKVVETKNGLKIKFKITTQDELAIISKACAYIDADGNKQNNIEQEKIEELAFSLISINDINMESMSEFKQLKKINPDMANIDLRRLLISNLPIATVASLYQLYSELSMDMFKKNQNLARK